MSDGHVSEVGVMVTPGTRGPLLTPERCTICQDVEVVIGIEHSNVPEREMAMGGDVGLCRPCLRLFQEARLIELAIRRMAANHWRFSQAALMLFLLDIAAEVHEQGPQLQRPVDPDTSDPTPV